MKREYNVSGMMCHNCEKRLEDALYKLGAKEVHADRTRNLVEIESELSDQSIKETIEDLGFDINA